MVDSDRAAEQQAKSERWRRHLEYLLAEFEDLIEKSEQRIADHQQLMQGLDGDERHWEARSSTVA